MTATVRPDSLRPWLRPLLALTLVLVWTMYLYRDTGVAMVSIWVRSETFTHAFLVPPIVLWLVWRQRQALALQLSYPASGAYVFVFLACFVWLLGDLVAVNAVTQLALVGLMVLAVPAVLGWAVARQIIFPLCFLFFAVPLGEFAMPQLMEWTANFAVLALRLTGIPVYREGLQFVIPSGSWSVVEACSGVRYLIASFTVGTLFAYLNYQSPKRRILFVVVSLLVPVVANWLRAYMIVLLGHVSGNKLAAGVDHLIYGWLFFGVVIMLMFFIGSRWAEPEPQPASISPAQNAPARSATDASLWVGALALCVIVSLPHMALSEIHRNEGSAKVVLTAPETLASGWQRVISTAPDFKPNFQNPSGETNARYTNAGQPVGLYLAYYRGQSSERKLVSSDNALVRSNDPQWSLVGSGTRELELGGERVVMRTAELRGMGWAGTVASDRLIAWQTYWINGVLTESDAMAKIYSAFNRLTGRGDDSAVIVVYTRSGDDMGSSQGRLKSFVSENYMAISDFMLNTGR